MKTERDYRWLLLLAVALAAVGLLLTAIVVGIQVYLLWR